MDQRELLLFAENTDKLSLKVFNLKNFKPFLKNFFRLKS